MRTWMLAVTLLAAGWAGCLESTADEPTPEPVPTAGAAGWNLFLCKDGVRAATPDDFDACNHRVTKPLLDPSTQDWTTQHGPANEVSIAVDPTNPMRLAGGGKDYTVSYLWNDTRDCGQYTVWMGTYWSTDGGLTWGNDLMPGFPNDPRDSPLKGNLCNTDPVLVFDDDGTLFYSGLNYRGAREDSPGFNSPNGHDLLTGSQLYFARSVDGGATYGDITFAAQGDNDAIFNDKQWFAVQPGGDHLLATWSQFQTTGLPQGVPVGGSYLGLFDTIMYTESFDNGATWTPARPFTPGGGPAANGQFSMAQYLPGGQSMAAIWLDFNQIEAAGRTANVVYTEGTLAPTGMVWEPTQLAFPVNLLKSDPGRDGTGPTKFRISTYPVLAIDASGGEFNGRRYVIWDDQEGAVNTDTQVLVRWSDDGQTWSDATSPASTATGDQIMPWIDVDPDGNVHAVWYDRRHDPENRLMDVYHAVSTDGGVTWSETKVTEIASDGDLGHHQNGSPFIGDYIGLDTASGVAYIMWADTRHTCDPGAAPFDAACPDHARPGRMLGSDVYSATIVRDMAAANLFD